MSYLTVIFDDNETYNRLGRPRGTVSLKDKGGPHGADWFTWALLDTGATHLTLPTQAANWVGLSLANATPVNVLTAGGLVTMHQIDVDVEIHSVRIVAPCWFAPGAKPLIGHETMLKAMRTVGFNASEWLIKW